LARELLNYFGALNFLALLLVELVVIQYTKLPSEYSWPVSFANLPRWRNSWNNGQWARKSFGFLQYKVNCKLLTATAILSIRDEIAHTAAVTGTQRSHSRVCLFGKRIANRILSVAGAVSLMIRWYADFVSDWCDFQSYFVTSSVGVCHLFHFQLSCILSFQRSKSLNF